MNIAKSVEIGVVLDISNSFIVTIFFISRGYFYSQRYFMYSYRLLRITGFHYSQRVTLARPVILFNDCIWRAYVFTAG